MKVKNLTPFAVLLLYQPLEAQFLTFNFSVYGRICNSRDHSKKIQGQHSVYQLRNSRNKKWSRRSMGTSKECFMIDLHFPSPCQLRWLHTPVCGCLKYPVSRSLMNVLTKLSRCARHCLSYFNVSPPHSLWHDCSWSYFGIICHLMGLIHFLDISNKSATGERH